VVRSRHQAVLLPGIVLPAALAYADLMTSLGERADVRAKELEIYADDAPPADYSLEQEVTAALAEARDAGFERFHLVGYSAGGAIAATLAARHPGRLLSLALLEPAWLGNEEMEQEESAVWAQFRTVEELPFEEMMSRFVGLQLAPGVAPPPAPPGPPPPWMAKRPAAIAAILARFRSGELSATAFEHFEPPVLFVLGGRSNPDLYGAMARRAERWFPNYELEAFPERHHFDPPHRAEPERMADRLLAHWDLADRAA
jgi:pimeloyl-ACP methyl ester carboxylesterase